MKLNLLLQAGALKKAVIAAASITAGSAAVLSSASKPPAGGPSDAEIPDAIRTYNKDAHSFNSISEMTKTIIHILSHKSSPSSTAANAGDRIPAITTSTTAAATLANILNSLPSSTPLSDHRDATLDNNNHRLNSKAQSTNSPSYHQFLLQQLASSPRLTEWLVDAAITAPSSSREYSDIVFYLSQALQDTETCAGYLARPGSIKKLLPLCQNDPRLLHAVLQSLEDHTRASQLYNSHIGHHGSTFVDDGDIRTVLQCIALVKQPEQQRLLALRIATLWCTTSTKDRGLVKGFPGSIQQRLAQQGIGESLKTASSSVIFSEHQARKEILSLMKILSITVPRHSMPLLQMDAWLYPILCFAADATGAGYQDWELVEMALRTFTSCIAHHTSSHGDVQDITKKQKGTSKSDCIERDFDGVLMGGASWKKERKKKANNQMGDEHIHHKFTEISRKLLQTCALPLLHNLDQTTSNVSQSIAALASSKTGHGGQSPQRSGYLAKAAHDTKSADESLSVLNQRAAVRRALVDCIAIMAQSPRINMSSEERMSWTETFLKSLIDGISLSETIQTHQHQIHKKHPNRHAVTNDVLEHAITMQKDQETSLLSALSSLSSPPGGEGLGVAAAWMAEIIIQLSKKVRPWNSVVVKRQSDVTQDVPRAILYSDNRHHLDNNGGGGSDTSNADGGCDDYEKGVLTPSWRRWWWWWWWIYSSYWTGTMDNTPSNDADDDNKISLHSNTSNSGNYNEESGIANNDHPVEDYDATIFEKHATMALSPDIISSNAPASATGRGSKYLTSFRSWLPSSSSSSPSSSWWWWSSSPTTGNNESINHQDMSQNSSASSSSSNRWMLGSRNIPSDPELALYIPAAPIGPSYARSMALELMEACGRIGTYTEPPSNVEDILSPAAVATYPSVSATVDMELAEKALTQALKVLCALGSGDERRRSWMIHAGVLQALRRFLIDHSADTSAVHSNTDDSSSIPISLQRQASRVLALLSVERSGAAAVVTNGWVPWLQWAAGSSDCKVASCAARALLHVESAAATLRGDEEKGDANVAAAWKDLRDVVGSSTTATTATTTAAAAAAVLNSNDSRREHNELTTTAKERTGHMAIDLIRTLDLAIDSRGMHPASVPLADRLVLHDGVHLFDPLAPHHSALAHHGVADRSQDAPLVDVVFVHGIRGGAFATWRKQGVGARGAAVDSLDKAGCWPATWIAPAIPQARLISAEYAAPASGWEGESLPFRRTAEYLAERLVAAGVGQRPVVFVTHSMGGLVIKDIIARGVTQEGTEAEKQLAGAVTGVVFYSVPHAGSRLADVGLTLRYVGAAPAHAVSALSPGPHLDLMNDAVRTLVRKRGLKVLSFSEGLPTPLPASVMATVVPHESAYPGYGEFVVLNGADHIAVCKPKDEEDASYVVLMKFLRERVVDAARAAADARSATEDHMEAAL